jgi:hypothetical protein
MSAELRDSPRLKEAEWRAQKEASRTARAKAEVEEEVQDLERFEDHLNVSCVRSVRCMSDV